MYVPLKITTDYSLLRSLIKIDDLIAFLNQNNINACAICDENLYGVMEFYNKCLENKIKPIISLEITLNDQPLYLYAKNYLGYQNLLKINTLKYEQDLKMEDLENLKEEILVIVPFKSIDLYDKLISIFNDVYIGYQTETEKVNSLLKTLDIVYVKDIKAFDEDDTNYLNYLEMIRDDIKFSDYQLKDFKENYFELNILDDDIKTTEKLSSLLNVIIPKNNNYIPKYRSEIDASWEYLEYLTKKGLNKRLNGQINKEYEDRLAYELSVIKKMGFADYILIVYDYVLYSKKNHILVGPGRGSAAGSLVCYTLGITDIDPLKYNLLFERFLNPERVTMPDIDIDFDNTKRGEVIEYIKSRYGKEKVASIMTFQTLKSKLVLRDLSRIINAEKIVEYLLKNINGNITLKENYQNDLVKGQLAKNSELKKIYKIALKLEGLKKNISTHAAGVVISSKNLDEIIPIVKNKDNILTGITMEYLEDLGLLKMDLLAIKNLTIISNIIELIKKDTGKTINLSSINLNDQSVLNIFSKGDTTGIFQFESRGMKNFLEKLKPESFLDLVASLALYRPGPMDNIDSFIKRKENKEKIDYIIPELEPILKETKGIIVYQEQVMQILAKVASYSFSEADIVRRAMSKKKKDVLIHEEEKFIKRATSNGYGKKAKELYELILKFAGYGFNKSHSVSYALIGYQMAYLKVKFPKYFITNLLNMSVASEIKTNEYLLEAKKCDLKIEKPLINLSNEDYKIDNNILILPFSIIKGINNLTIISIIEEREKNGLFIDFTDFVKRMYNKNINEHILEILISADVFREFNNIKTLKENLAKILNYAELASSIENPLIPRPVMTEFLMENEENNEYQSYGFYISNHPTSKYQSDKYIRLIDLADYFDKYIRVVVLVSDIKKTKTKTGEEMAFLTASDESSVGNFVVFHKQIGLLNDLKINDIVEIMGRATKRYDKYQINVNNIIKK